MVLADLTLADADGPVRALPRIREHNTRPIRQQNLLPFGGGIRRQAQFHAVSLGGSDHGIGDSGVSAGGVQNRPSRRELSGEDRLHEHSCDGSVLDGSTRIGPLRFGEDFRATVGRFGECNPEKAGSADEGQGGKLLEEGTIAPHRFNLGHAQGATETGLAQNIS